jgi:hypothetical protein
MEHKETGPTTELIAKKLRTGELAIWDPKERAIVLIDPTTKQASEGIATARIIKGATLKALEEALGDVVVLI